jgi:hypothetical protein
MAGNRGQEISYGLESFSQAEARIYRTIFLYGKQSLRSAVSTADRFYFQEPAGLMLYSLNACFLMHSLCFCHAFTMLMVWLIYVCRPFALYSTSCFLKKNESVAFFAKMIV